MKDTTRRLIITIAVSTILNFPAKNIHILNQLFVYNYSDSTNGFGKQFPKWKRILCPLPRIPVLPTESDFTKKSSSEMVFTKFFLHSVFTWNHSGILILRSAKSAVFTHSETLNLDIYEFLHFLKVEIKQ